MTNFDERARDWDSDPDKVERARVVAEAIRAGLPLTATMTALEYGCGTGLLSFALQPDFSSIMLADTSQGMLDVLSAKIKDAGFDNLHPIRLDLTNQPALPTHFDVIFSLMVMHHIAEIAIVLRQFHTLLNPDGYLCIADLEKEDGSFHGPEVRDVHPGFDRTELEAQVLEAGFRVVSFSKVYSIKKLVNGREKLFPIFLMVTKKNV